MYVADLVLVGTGVKPDDALAAAAGLDVQDGIVVDAQCRTSDPDIFAAGDVHALRHAAGRGAAGELAARPGPRRGRRPQRRRRQRQLQHRCRRTGASSTISTSRASAGPIPRAQKVRRPLPDKSALLLETKDGVVTYALGINAQRDLAAVRRLIERRIPVDAAALADPAQPFNAMLKAKA